MPTGTLPAWAGRTCQCNARSTCGPCASCTSDTGSSNQAKAPRAREALGRECIRGHRSDGLPNRSGNVASPEEGRCFGQALARELRDATLRQANLRQFVAELVEKGRRPPARRPFADTRARTSRACCSSARAIGICTRRRVSLSATCGESRVPREVIATESPPP